MLVTFGYFWLNIKKFFNVIASTFGFAKIHRLKKDWDSVTASILEEKASTSGLKVAVEPVMGVQSRIGEKRRKINEDICDITEKVIFQVGI